MANYGSRIYHSLSDTPNYFILHNSNDAEESSLSGQEIKVDPLNDLLFKKMLATESQKHILQGFIKDFFEMDVALDEIILVTPYSIKSYQEYRQKESDAENQNPDDIAKTFTIIRETHRDFTL